MICPIFQSRCKRTVRLDGVLSKICRPYKLVGVQCSRSHRLQCLRCERGSLLVLVVVRLVVLRLYVKLESRRLVKGGILGLRLPPSVDVSKSCFSICI